MKPEQLTGSTDVGERSKNDFYPTPSSATLALLKREKFYGSIWEPACGDGAISKVLRDSGYTRIMSTDLVNRGFGTFPVDFLKQDTCLGKYDNIITNPPYSLAEEFVRHALRCTNQKVAMLLKLNFLEGQKRYKLFQETTLKRVYVFSKRISFNGRNGKGNGLLAYAWFVWEHERQSDVFATPASKPTIDWILE